MFHGATITFDERGATPLALASCQTYLVLMQDKYRVWSESRDSAEDLTFGLNSGLNDGLVRDTIARRGVVFMSDCPNCGRQTKEVLDWGEVTKIFLGLQIAGVAATRQGVVVRSQCRGCNRSFRTIVDWDEVRRYVDVGVRMGALNPKIRQAVARL